MYQRQLDVKATRNHTLYDSRKSERLWPYGCTPVDEKERVGGSWLSRGVPTPRVPRTRELRTRGAPRGSSRPMLAIQLLAIRVMYASTGDVLESNVEHNFQQPPAPAFFLLLTAWKKRGRILYKETEGQRLPDCWCHLREPSSSGAGGVDRRMSLSWTGGVTKKSLGHRLSPRAAVTEDQPRTDSFKALPSLAGDSFGHKNPTQRRLDKMEILP